MFIGRRCLTGRTAGKGGKDEAEVTDDVGEEAAGTDFEADGDDFVSPSGPLHPFLSPLVLGSNGVACPNSNCMLSKNRSNLL